jgi:hypothetical protein
MVPTIISVITGPTTPLMIVNVVMMGGWYEPRVGVSTNVSMPSRNASNTRGRP